jgi:hypothetical protein
MAGKHSLYTYLQPRRPDWSGRGRSDRVLTAPKTQRWRRPSAASGQRRMTLVELSVRWVPQSITTTSNISHSAFWGKFDRGPEINSASSIFSAANFRPRGSRALQLRAPAALRRLRVGRRLTPNTADHALATAFPENKHTRVILTP